MNVNTGRVSMEHLPCETCEDKKGQAFVVCRLCKMQMCEECFRYPLEKKVCKMHKCIRQNAQRGCQDRNTDFVQLCQEHKDVPLNWYCSTHNKVGCAECLWFGGCIIKSCQLEKIQDKAVTFKDSEEFTALAVQVSKRTEDMELKINKIEDTKMCVMESHDKFKNDVEACGNKLIGRVKKLVKSMLNEGDEAFCKSNTDICLLEEKYRSIAESISSIKNAIQPQNKTPCELFINSVKSRQKLKDVDEQLLELEQKKSIMNYEFCPDPKLEAAIIDCRLLGAVKELINIKHDQDEGNNSIEPRDSSKEFQVPVPQTTYFLNPKNDVTTKKFADKFEAFLGGRIKVVHTSSSDQCKDNLPIALLCRPQTDREFVEIESTLKLVPANMHQRIAVIYIHIVNDKAFLPSVPTKTKVSEIKNVGIILDVGFKDSKMLPSAIYPCKHTNTRNSTDAFVDFVNLVIQKK